MMRRAAAAIAGLGATLLLAAGCSEQKYQFSGFLEDYSKLTKSSFDPDVLSYRDPDTDFTRYLKIHVQTVSVDFAHSEDEAMVRPDRLATYKQWVHDDLRKGLAKYDLDSPQPGDNVAELRFQVANMRLTRKIDTDPKQRWRQLYQTGSCNVEAALVDGRTGSVLWMYVGDRVPPEWIESWSEQDAWESLQASTSRAVDRWVTGWAPRFVALSRPAGHASDGEGVE